MQDLGRFGLDDAGEARSRQIESAPGDDFKRRVAPGRSIGFREWVMLSDHNRQPTAGRRKAAAQSAHALEHASRKPRGAIADLNDRPQAVLRSSIRASPPLGGRVAMNFLSSQ